MMRGLAAFRDCNRGASVIEFALAAPFLATLLIGMIDISRAYSDRLLLEQAAQRAIERVEQQRSVATDYGPIKADAAQQAGITQTTSNPQLTQWLECSSDNGATWTSQGNNTITSQCPNGTDLPARYVTIRITKPFAPTFGARFFPGVNSNGTVTLAAEAGIRVQ
jgi:Flp pilus assembly protein TadG